MEDNLEEKLFVDEKTERLILSNFKQYKTIALLWMLISAVSFCISLVTILSYTNHPIANWPDALYYIIMPWLYLSIVVVNLVLLFYYFNAFRLQKRAVTESNQGLFTKSFLLFNKGNYASMCALFLNLVNDSIILLFDLNYFAPQ